MDISGFFNQFFGYILTWFKWVYNTLDDITFNGISLLTYCISILLISAVLPLVLTLVHTGADKVHSGYEEITYTKRYEKQLKRDEIHARKEDRAKVNYVAKGGKIRK